ncbi:MAG: hypothetical protein ACI4OT_02870 [Bacilli bacterium]
MNRKEKKLALEKAKEYILDLDVLEEKINLKQEKLDKLSQECDSLEEQVQHYKLYLDLEESIKELEKSEKEYINRIKKYKTIESHEEYIDFLKNEIKECEDLISSYCDVDSLVFAAYKLQESSNIYNIGVFEVDSDDDYMLFQNIFSSSISGVLDNDEENIEEAMVLIKSNNIIPFWEVIPYMPEDFVLKGAYNKKDIMQVYKFVVQNAELFGLVSKEDKVIPMQKIIK